MSIKKSLFVFSIILVFVFFLTDCQRSLKKNTDNDATEIRDSTLFYLDSSQITNFFATYPLSKNYQQYLESFYNKRKGAFAWINNTGINEYGKNLINLLNHEAIIFKTDSIFYRNRLHALYDILSEEDYKFSSRDSQVSELEFLFTASFFDYAKRNWKGISNTDLKKVSWFIERKKLNYDDLLDTILKSEAPAVSSFEPVYRQYRLLKRYLQKYNDLEKEDGWTAWYDQVKELKKGDTAVAIVSVKKQLNMLDDLLVNDGTNLFNNELEDAVKNFQKRHGLKEDGIIAGKTLQAMSVPLYESMQKILINMERSRWVPAEQKGDYIAVNIPDFKLHVYSDDSLLWSCNVIVGKSQIKNNTVIFNNYLEYIVFSPYWNIPKNILIKETLPSIKEDLNYLSEHDMEIVDASGQPVALSSIDWNKYKTSFPYTIRQKPGKNNALGLVKFLFPNVYDIYMHDTPEKSLFGETTRTFSHGCIRLEEPYKLVRFLLRQDTAWTDEKIIALLNGGEQTFVKLKNKVPIFIAYFTAWVDRNGKLNFRDDVYHHDEKMKELLFLADK